jgi:hypothetical protein
MSAMAVYVLILVVGVIVFIALREFWCWYFKINEKINLMREQNELLKNIKKHNEKIEFLMNITDPANKHGINYLA